MPKKIVLIETFVVAKLLSLFWDSEVYYHVNVDLPIDWRFCSLTQSSSSQPIS